jgi:alpha-galactosidase
MMKYGTMIWTSDNTYPKARTKIQYSSLLAYPAATMSCHVSNPENVCSSPAELKFRYEVALGGALGYEMHLPNASKEICDTVKQQILNYREYEDIILRGDYYSLYNPFECDINAYYYADKNHDRILLSVIEVHGMRERKYKISVQGADPDATYYDKIGGKTYTGRELIYGLDYRTHDTDPYSQMWYFIKQ